MPVNSGIFFQRRSLLSAGRIVFAALGIALFSLASAFARAPAEYELKAAFLYNFASFTEWPAEAFETPDSPFVIGIVGKDPFGAILDGLVRGEHVGNHAMTVRRASSIDELPRCHILYVDASEAANFTKIIHRLRGQPVLTVADIPGFAEAGGTIGFVTSKKIELTINPAALQSAKLNCSSKLLRLARLVSADPVHP